MKSLLRNPISLWFQRLTKAKIMEFQNRDKHLNIGYMSIVKNCRFGIYNTIYDKVSLHDCTLGDFTFIASDTKISQTKIGKYCSIGPDCKIGLGMHPSRLFVSTHPVFFSTLKQAQISFADQDHFLEYETISIGNDVWIGANALVVDGVTINDGAIVAAGSVVTKDVPPYAIVGGVPSRVIRYRFDEEEIKSLLKISWWDFDVETLKKSHLKFHNVKDFLADD